MMGQYIWHSKVTFLSVSVQGYSSLYKNNIKICDIWTIKFIILTFFITQCHVAHIQDSREQKPEPVCDHV